MATKKQLANQRAFGARMKAKAAKSGGKKKAMPAFLAKKLGRKKH